MPIKRCVSSWGKMKPKKIWHTIIFRECQLTWTQIPIRFYKTYWSHHSIKSLKSWEILRCTNKHQRLLCKTITMVTAGMSQTNLPVWMHLNTTVTETDLQRDTCRVTIALYTRKVPLCCVCLPCSRTHRGHYVPLEFWYSLGGKQEREKKAKNSFSPEMAYSDEFKIGTVRGGLIWS